MRSKIAAVLVGTAFLLGGAPSAIAKTAQLEFSGNVSRINSTAKTLVVKEPGTKTRAEMSFTLSPDAKIMQGSKAKSLAALKVGERVRVTYVDQGPGHQAQRIELLPAETAKATPAKTAPRKSN